MEDKVPDGSEDLVIASLLESWSKYTSSWIARQHTFFLDLVLMREVENWLMEMGTGKCILNGKSGRIVSERTKMGWLSFSETHLGSIRREHRTLFIYQFSIPSKSWFSWFLNDLEASFPRAAARLSRLLPGVGAFCNGRYIFGEDNG